VMADLVSDATGVVADVALIEAHTAMAALHLAGARATAGLAGQHRAHQPGRRRRDRHRAEGGWLRLPETGLAAVARGL